MHIDPEKYDAAKLTGDELLSYRGWACARHALDVAFGEVMDECAYDNRTPKLNDLMLELHQAIQANIDEYMELSETEFVCSLMEANPGKYFED